MLRAEHRSKNNLSLAYMCVGDGVIKIIPGSVSSYISEKPAFRHCEGARATAAIY